MKEYYSKETISGHITRITLPGDVYAYLAEGDRRAALIDTGFGAGSLKAYVEELLQGKPYFVLLTHGHFDHAGGASEFEEVYMDPADLELARKHTEKKIRMDALKNGFCEEDLAEPKKDGYLPLHDGQVFDLGGEMLKIMSLHGHTRGSVGVLFEEERILLAGDACCSFTLLFGEEDSLSVREYREELEKAWDRYHGDFDEMLYSHPHNYGGPEVMTEMIELCGEILEGRDDRIPSEGLFGIRTCIAKLPDEYGRRRDGKKANLQYAESSLR